MEHRTHASTAPAAGRAQETRRARLPRRRECHPPYAGTRPAGCVVYGGSKVDIPAEAVDAKFIDAFEYFLGVIASLEPALKVPSRHECRFCDIARTECPERIEG